MELHLTWIPFFNGMTVVLNYIVIEISPFRIVLFNEILLPVPLPFFYLSFPGACMIHGVVNFEIDEELRTVFL